MTYDEGVHWTCYCAHQPRCCEFGEPACCSGCENERDYRAVADDEDDCGSCSCVAQCHYAGETL